MKKKCVEALLTGKTTISGSVMPDDVFIESLSYDIAKDEFVIIVGSEEFIPGEQLEYKLTPKRKIVFDDP